MQCDHFIIDTYDTLTAVKQAAQLGLSYSWVVHRRGVLRKEGYLPEVRAYHPVWTPEQNEYLADHYPFTTMRRMMKFLKRTAVAIKVQAQKLGLLRVSEDYPALTLAKILGCSGATVARYVKDGYLKGKQSYKLGAHRRWVIAEEDVVTFIRTYPWLLSLTKMQEVSYFRSVLREEWAKNPWYTPTQAAKRVGCGLEAIRLRLASGVIKGFKRGSYWWVREKDLLEQYVRLQGGHYTVAR